MLKSLIVGLAALGMAPAVIAQNATDIAKVQSGMACSGCNLFQADLAYRDIPSIDVSKSRLRQSNLSLSTMNNANFEGADISVANLFAGRFTSANFKNADLSSSVLVGAYFGFADMTGANLTGANLSGAEFKTARGLSQSQLNQACGDAATELPTGFSVPLCAKRTHY